jgi:hypothetical protein
MKTTVKPSGFIFYRGASMLDGKPIIGVAITKKSSNAKTGNIIQTYILVDNKRSPVENAKTLADVSICGDCKHRRGTGGSCYVNLGQGPRAVADGINRGIYPEDWESLAASIHGRPVRLGTYGDPMAIPYQVWDRLLQGSSAHSGYSHQWNNKHLPSDQVRGIMQYCMASSDSVTEHHDARSLGYRTFRVRTADEPLQESEFICPASEEKGKMKTCSECMACSGGIDSRKANPAIIVHGSLKSRFISIRAI